MTLKIGIISQKGGVSKSSVARLLAKEYAANEWFVKIADMDTNQGTCTKWNARRMTNGHKPDISVEQFSTVKQVKKIYNTYDLVIFDGKPYADSQTVEIAKESDIIIIPTGNSLDDLEPTIELANSLRALKIDLNKVIVALPKVGTSNNETDEVKKFIQGAGYSIINTEIPEKTAYRRAMDLGLTMTETTFPTLNQKADLFAQEIMNKIEELKVV